MPITSPFFSRFFFVGPNYGAPTAPSWKTSSPAARFSVNNSLSAILFMQLYKSYLENFRINTQDALSQ